MKNTSPSLTDLIESVTLGVTDTAIAMPARPATPDGRNILDPVICSVSGNYRRCSRNSQPRDLAILHNHSGSNAADYPLRASTGIFFSEIMSGPGGAQKPYLDLVARCMSKLAASSLSSPMTFDDLLMSGREMQTLDAEFAESLIGAPLDAYHRCIGPDEKHPYSKITVCRSTFPVQVGSALIWFYFEKFLVAYSYLANDGARQSTKTPIHSHPLNFETVYFTSYGKQSRVIELEFDLETQDGQPLVNADGQLISSFLNATGDAIHFPLSTKLKNGSQFLPDVNPRILAPFESELQLCGLREHISRTDGLFRPHQVTVMDDPDEDTRYFALDNYFGPTGRVLIFEDDTIQLWQHAKWLSKSAK